MTPYLFLFVTVVLTVVSQVLQKRVAMMMPEPATGVLSYLGLPLFWIALTLLGLAMVSWLVVLDLMEVSKAYTLLSVNYVLMVPVSKAVFDEEIPWTRWAGVLVIMAGVALISWS